MTSLDQADTLPLRPKLSFASAAYEDGFCRYYHGFYYRYAQASLAVGMVLILGDYLVDRLAFDAPANFDRIRLCLPLLGLGLAYSFTDTARRHWQSVMSSFIVAVACSLFWVLSIIDHQGGMGLKSWVGILNFTFLEFYCFVILGVQFRFALPAGLAILLVFGATMQAELGADVGAFFYWSYHVVTLFILAAGIGWWREFLIRKDFSTQTTLKAARDILKNQNGLLEIEVDRRTREIQEMQDATIVVLASLVETRDNETGNHIRRTQHFVRALGRRLQSHPAFAAHLAGPRLDILFKSAPLHDIGKVGIPDSILLKPGRLDPAEFEIMKTHATLAHDAIEKAERQLGISVDFLACAKEIALNHHEKWDGSGYPRGLAGAAIPVSARLMAVADVYDALTTHRVYKDAMSHEEAVTTILDGRGRHFDPDVVDAFGAIHEQFREIAARYAEEDAYEPVERRYA